MSRREDAAFARGDIGVDGEVTEEKRAAAEVERARAREQFLEGKTWLGREFLTWLLWKSESSEPLMSFDGEPVHVLFGGKLTLRGIAGEVIELGLKGTEAAYSQVNRFALENGLLIHAAKLKLTLGEKEFDFTLDAQLLDIRTAKLPDLLTDDEDDRIQERLFLTERLGEVTQAIFMTFLALRRGPEWRGQVLPEILSWLKGE
ncbi:MAG: hypothetical protein LBM75_07625 [Myxococcales bacterium]|jgi:hypothetical protein|nr:hypothetical protein [Myxococcales bacterium]